MAFDLSEVVSDPDLGDDFLILRSSGSFGAGGWIQGPIEEIPAFGVIQPAEDEALAMVPEGDRVTGSLQVFTAQPIYETLAERRERRPNDPDWTSDNRGAPAQAALSDKIRWHGHLYRILAVQKWRDYGYFGAILVRLTGD
jgi:hypothetical protein